VDVRVDVQYAGSDSEVILILNIHVRGSQGSTKLVNWEWPQRESGGGFFSQSRPWLLGEDALQQAQQEAQAPAETERMHAAGAERAAALKAGAGGLQDVYFRVMWFLKMVFRGPSPFP
jgi:hypothetical protein